MKEKRYIDAWERAIIPTAVLVIILLVLAVSCSPKIIERVETKIEYRDRVVHDTATFEVPVEVEKIVTRDTVSHLENNWAKSDAVVSEGLLHHSLESKPKKVYVPVEVHVTDTIWRQKKTQVVTKIKEVEKPLSWWKSFKLDAFWWLLAAVLVLLAWTFRKTLLKLLAL